MPEKSISRYAACLLSIALSKALRKQCIDTDTGSDSDRNDQHLHRECQRQCIERCLSAHTGFSILLDDSFRPKLFRCIYKYMQTIFPVFQQIICDIFL